MSINSLGDGHRKGSCFKIVLNRSSPVHEYHFGHCHAGRTFQTCFIAFFFVDLRKRLYFVNNKIVLPLRLLIFSWEGEFVCAIYATKISKKLSQKYIMRHCGVANFELGHRPIFPKSCLPSNVLFIYLYQPIE